MAKVGRPPLYKTAKQLQDKIDQYFIDGFRKKKFTTKEGKEVEIPYITITGLVLYLGFCDRHSFYDLENQIEFSHTIKRARTFIEQEYEELMRSQPIAGIFALKNFGWSDKLEVKQEVIPNMEEVDKKIADLLAKLNPSGKA